MGVLIFVAGGSFGIWSADKFKNDSAVSNQNKQNKSQNIAADNSASNSDATKNRGTNRGQGGQRGGTVGVIKKIDGSVLEMETPDGKIVKVTSSETTRVLSTSSESFAALKVGDSVSVLGDTDANGAITSNLITKGEGAPRSAGSNGNPPQTADQSANQGAKEKGKTTEALNAINYDPASMDLGGKPTAPAKEEPKQVASRPAFSSKPKEEVDIVQFVAEEEAAVAQEPVKRESKKAVEAAPVELESLLQEWED